MQTNQYEFKGVYVYKNGKRLSKWELLCVVESMNEKVYRLIWGYSTPMTHYDHENYNKLAMELKMLVANYKRLTKN